MSDMKKTEFRQTTGVVSILSAQKDTRQKDDCEKNISIGGLMDAYRPLNMMLNQSANGMRHLLLRLTKNLNG